MITEIVEERMCLITSNYPLSEIIYVGREVTLAPRHPSTRTAVGASFPLHHYCHVFSGTIGQHFAAQEQNCSGSSETRAHKPPEFQLQQQNPRSTQTLRLQAEVVLKGSHSFVHVPFLRTSPNSSGAQPVNRETHACTEFRWKTPYY